MSKDYLDKWEERAKQNTEIIEQQQTKTKKMNKYTVYDMWSAFVIGFLVGGGTFCIIISILKQ